MNTQEKKWLVLLAVGGIFLLAGAIVVSHTNGEPVFSGTLAAIGPPYWSGEPETYIDINNVPPGDDIIAVSTEGLVLLALRSNGSIECWGDYREGICDFPREKNYSAISAGSDHNLALRKNGSIVCWNMQGAEDQCRIPPGDDFISISAGEDQNLGLCANGTIVQWQYARKYIDARGPPSGNDFIAIAAGSSHNLALRSNGTIVCWEPHADPRDDLCAVPPNNDYVSIAAFGMNSLALRANGELVAWSLAGREYTPPGNDYRAISASTRQNLALRSDGTIVCWGSPEYEAVCNSSTAQDTIAASMGGLRALTIRNPHAKEILAGEWKRSTDRIVRTSATNRSGPARHPALYPDVSYRIDTTLPAVPDSVMTYTAKESAIHPLPSDLPYQDPELLKNPYIAYKKFSIISPEQSVEELKTHRLTVDETFLWHNSIRTSDAIVITNVSLKYTRQMSPSQVTCYQPVYSFTGYVQNGTVRSTGFIEDVPATDHLVAFYFL